MMTRRIRYTLLAALAAAFALAAAAAAAGGYTIVLNDPAPAYGETVSFSVDTKPSPHGTYVLFVEVNCSQDGTQVYDPPRQHTDTPDESGGVYPDVSFTLSSPTWAGGPAGCEAILSVLNNRRGYVEKNRLSFHVTG